MPGVTSRQTIVNVEMGKARSRVSTIVAGLVLLLLVTALSEVMAKIPMAVLAKYHGHRVGAGVHIAAQAIAVQIRCAPGARFAGVKRTIRARLRRGESRLQVIRFGQQRR